MFGGRNGKPRALTFLLAVAGLALAVGVGLAANAVSKDSIGLSAQPVRAGESLAPPAAREPVEHPRRARSRARRAQRNKRDSDAAAAPAAPAAAPARPPPRRSALHRRPPTSAAAVASGTAPGTPVGRARKTPVARARTTESGEDEPDRTTPAARTPVARTRATASPTTEAS